MEGPALRILHVVNDFLPFTRAGTEHYLAELMAWQAGQGQAPQVLHLTPPDMPPPDLPATAYAILPGHYKQVPSAMLAVPAGHRRRLENPDVREAVAAWLQIAQPEVIHVHSLIGLTASFLEAIPEDVPVLMTLHDFWFPCANAILVRGDGTICPGPEERACARCLVQAGDCAASALDRVRRRIAVHRQAFRRLDLILAPSRFSHTLHARCGFDSPRLLRSPLGMQSVPRQEHSARGDGLRLVCLGGLCWFKGQDLAVQAFLAANLHGARLELHGRESSPEFAAILRNLAGDDSRITFHGAYDKGDLGRLLAGADVLLLPSRMESYSFVAREALSAGVPVVAADCGALPEIVRHGRNGLLFRSGDAAHLALTLRRLQAEPDLLPRLRAGLGPVFSMEEDASHLLRLYQSCLAGRRASVGSHGQPCK